MPSLDDIFGVLTNTDKQIAEDDPYSGYNNLADSIIQQARGGRVMDMEDSWGRPVRMQTRPPSIGESIITGLLGGAAKGYFGGLSEDYRAEQSDRATKALTSALEGGDLTRPEGLSGSVWTPIQRQASAFRLGRKFKEEDEKAQAKREGAKTLLTAYAGADTPQARQGLGDLAKTLGILSGDATLPAEVVPIARPSLGEEDTGPKLGVPSVRERETAAFGENVAQGMPAIQAATSAKSAAEDLRRRSRDLFSTRLGAESDTIASVEDLVRKGEQGLATAGRTGSAIGSNITGALSYFPGTFPESAKMAAGDALLNQTQQLGLAANRVKGTGALSDFESRALFNTAMSPTKTKPQNEAILEQYKNGLEIMKEHNSFINHFLERTGGSPERAQTLWELYKSENPIVVQNESGEYGINKKREPWQTFDFDAAYKKYLKGEKPGEAGAVPTTTIGGDIVTIRNKKTGETMRVPRSSLGGR